MNSVAINSDGDFFFHARTDPALLHSVLYLVALHHDLALGISDSSEALYHGGEALRVIKGRLEEGIFSDMTIAAVAMLVTKEVDFTIFVETVMVSADYLQNLNGNYKASKIHMYGLECMVKQRGGIRKIQGVFGRIVTWSDFCYANAWNCLPRFPRISPKNRRESSDFNVLDVNHTLLAPKGLSGPRSPIISIFALLRNLSSILDPQSGDQIDRQNASRMIYDVEYELLLLNKEHADDLEPNERLCSFEEIPLKIAAHIWLYLVAREVPRTSTLLHSIVERLQDALEIQLEGWWTATYQRQTWLLWMLFVGGAASAGRYERWWFVGKLWILCGALEILSAEALEQALKRVLWQKAWCRSHLRSIWNDVVMSEEGKNGACSS